MDKKRKEKEKMIMDHESKSAENNPDLTLVDEFVELKVNNGGECANVVELFSAGFVSYYTIIYYTI